MTLHILIVDDEPAAREVLADAVTQGGHSVDVAATVSEAKGKLASGDFDVALCDVQLSDGCGIELVRYSRAADLDTTCLVVTAFASMETAVEALRAGAFDYLIKPVRHVEVLHRLSQIEALYELRTENKALRKAMRESKPIYRCTSSAMSKVEKLVEKIGPTDNTVLISGESGTGKSVIARALHEHSARRDGPFVPVNCGAIPEQLLESEFFGHTKGAFTSADRARKGLFVEADRGTLFLDEISELPVHMQTKLLHAIEDKYVRPLGSVQTRRVDVRVVAATNGQLTRLIAQGRFREDLYFRLSVFEIGIPPLRERGDDIRGLIQFFLKAYRDSAKSSRRLGIQHEAEELLLKYSWPGNVRELDNIMTRACLLCEGDSISIDDLPSTITRMKFIKRAAKTISSTASLQQQRREFEAEVIRQAIYEAGGDRRLAAQRLQISMSSLYAKLNEGGVEQETDRSSGELPVL